MNLVTEVLSLLGPSKKSLLERWTDRFLQAIEQTAGSLEGAGSRAAEAAESARQRARPYVHDARERARSSAAAGRDALAERVDAITRRAEEIRGRRERRREVRRARRRSNAGRAAPMQFDLRHDDRVVLRSRRPVDLRFGDGGQVRYRFIERPSFAQRILLHLTGRRIWPPR